MVNRELVKKQIIHISILLPPKIKNPKPVGFAASYCYSYFILSFYFLFCGRDWFQIIHTFLLSLILLS